MKDIRSFLKLNKTLEEGRGYTNLSRKQLNPSEGRREDDGMISIENRGDEQVDLEGGLWPADSRGDRGYVSLVRPVGKGPRIYSGGVRSDALRPLHLGMACHLSSSDGVGPVFLRIEKI